MQKKDFYRRKLPHFQVQGQCFFVTFSLYGALPKSVLDTIKFDVELAKKEIVLLTANNATNSDLQRARVKYQDSLKTYKKLYHSYLDNNLTGIVDLTSAENINVFNECLRFWNGNRIDNHAYCVMSNHVHWLFSLKDTDNEGKVVYLDDLLHSVKLYSAKHINANEKRMGKLWRDESFDTTIRDDAHFWNVVRYIINNPVKAGLIDQWGKWSGTYLEEDLKRIL